VAARKVGNHRGLPLRFGCGYAALCTLQAQAKQATEKPWSFFLAYKVKIPVSGFGVGDETQSLNSANKPFSFSYPAASAQAA
jgi:hypothetical protein